MGMNIVCLDLEGVLAPEIWVAFAEKAGIPDLMRTTRDEPDYDKLMQFRLDVLRRHGMGLPQIQEVIADIQPVPGAKEFLDDLRAQTQVIIISDTFEQFAQPIMEKLGWPTIFCNTLEVADDGTITGYRMRCDQTKLTTVRALHSCGFENIALALTIKGEKADAVRAKVDSTANMLGVTDVLQKYPRQMSGGQRQRVAAARAIVADPKLVLADEPTGALDSRNAAVLLETLEVLNAKLHATIMMVTHDAVAASYADRILFIKDGKLFNELRRGDSSRTDFYQRILEVQAFLSGKQGDSPAVSFAPSHAAEPRN